MKDKNKIFQEFQRMSRIKNRRKTPAAKPIHKYTAGHKNRLYAILNKFIDLQKKIITYLIPIFFVSSCLKDPSPSQIKAMASKDWFRQGVDRVYLAYTETLNGAPISESSPKLKYGQHLTYIVGCYAESKNPNKRVNVKPFANADFTVKMKLNERHKLGHFNLYENKKDAKKNKGCVVLNGADTQVNVIAHSSQNLDVASLPNPTGAVVVCSAALLSSLGTAATVITGSFTTTASGGATGPLAWIMVGGVASGTAATIYWCTAETDGLLNKLKTFHDQNNKSLFIQEYVSTIEKTMDMIMKNPEYQKEKDQYLKHKVNGDINLAVAVFNPIFVKNFNQHTTTKFQQGWGGIFDRDKFFRAITHLETNQELDEQGVPIDGKFIEHSIHCPNPEKLKTCVKNEEKKCYDKHCILPKDLVLLKEEKKK